MPPELTHSPLVLAEILTAVKDIQPWLSRAQIQRKILHWVQHKVLTPLGQESPGSGRSRKFSHEAAHIVALLLKLGRTEVDELRAVVRTITAMIARGDDNTALWRAAQDRRHPAPKDAIFAVISIENGSPLAVGIGLARGVGGFNTPSIRVEGDSAIFINLTFTFARLRFP